MSFCEKCGSRLNGEEAFCGSCGNAIVRGSTYQAVQSKPIEPSRVEVSRPEEPQRALQASKSITAPKEAKRESTHQTVAVENIILRDIHCPYCDSGNALLISQKTKSIVGLRFPAYGLRFILAWMYLAYLHVLIYGLKIIEATKETVYATYGFCPSCGNSYSAGTPEEVKTEENAPKFYRVRKGKVVTGFCQGVSEYSGIPVLWVRIVEAFFCATIIGLFIYFIIAVCIPFREDLESGAIHDKRFYKAKKGQGKVFMGLCKGISNYTEISVGWIRLLMVLLGFTVIGAILYIVLGAIAKDDEGKNNTKALITFAIVLVAVLVIVAVLFSTGILG